MLRLLLDEHISPKVAKGLRRVSRGIVAQSMAEWEGGKFLGQDDATCLGEAALQRFTLVTYDRKTIPPLLKTWTETGVSHGGVIFIDEKSISPADIGGLVRALAALTKEVGERIRPDSVWFLRR
jgi:hypothetical protein